FLREITQPFGIRDPIAWRRFAEHSIWEIKPGTFTLACDPEVLAPYYEQTQQFANIEDMDLSDAWAKVTCPTLVLRGKDSDVLSQRTAEDMAKQKNVKLVVFDGIGHAPSLMEERQITVVKDWLMMQAG